ncbi:MAG: hypothetical protein ETSY2_11625, partial [Candidatus Entotheonella gemina]
MVDSMRLSRTSALIGAAVWLAWVVGIAASPFETSWPTALLLLAALVLVPLCLGVVLDTAQSLEAIRSERIAMPLQLPAALALVVSCSLPEGFWAAVLALPWLGFTGMVALTGWYRLWRRDPAPLPELSVDAGLMYLVVGGAWTLLSRFGARPLAFSPEIVFLTAIHFHYAGFVLPILTGLAARAVGGGMASLATIGVIAGVPLVAVGITATQLGFGLRL